MNVLYKCRCMAAEVEVEVDDRCEGEDVVDWMRGVVQVEVSLDHANRSPLCREQVSQYVKIPYDGGRLGQAPGK